MGDLIKMQELTCPKCNSKEVIKRGILKTENGDRQRLGCNHCHHRFILNTPFKRMRNNEKVITATMDMYYSGMSFRKIKNHMNKFYPNSVSPSTIYRWLMKYVGVMANFTDQQEIKIGRNVQGDEVEYHRRTNTNKKGTEKNWFIDSIDTRSRFLVYSVYASKRTPETITKFYKDLKNKTGNQIEIVSTDGLKLYPRALKKTFGLKMRGSQMASTSKIIHNVTKSDSGRFNYKIERFHNTLRERTKVMRGFHGCMDSAQTILKGFEIYYNWIRENMALSNLTPSQIAVPNVQLQDKNKWLELINRGYNGK
jgi:transposase-like protein